MKKSIYTDEFAVLVALLRETREAAGLTQVELAQKIGTSQSFITKMEVGQRRLDMIQLRTVCHALGTTLPDFVTKLEGRMTKRKKS